MSLIDVDCPKDIFLQLISWTPHALVSPTFKEKKKQTENTFQKKKNILYSSNYSCIHVRTSIEGKTWYIDVFDSFFPFF